MSPYLMMIVVALIAFVLMLTPAARPQGAPRRFGVLGLVTAAAAAINAAGAAGLAWYAVGTLSYDGFITEGLIPALLMAAMLALTALAVVLRRRGRGGWVLVLLLIGALPTAAVLGLVLYLEANPIDMR